MRWVGSGWEWFERERIRRGVEECLVMARKLDFVRVRFGFESEISGQMALKLGFMRVEEILRE